MDVLSNALLDGRAAEMTDHLAAGLPAVPATRTVRARRLLLDHET